MSKRDLVVHLMPMVVNLLLVAFLVWAVMPAVDHMSKQVDVLKREREMMDQQDARDTKRITASEYLRRKEMEDLGKIMMQHHNLSLEVDKLHSKLKAGE